MRVVIIGMFQSERQIDLSLYPHLGIRFANKGKCFGIGQDDLIDSADRLLVMTKFVSHKATEKLDRSKVTFINGGITRLREALANLNATAKIDVPELPTRVEFAAATIEEEEDMSKRIDWSVFKTAKVGDVLVFQRPPKMTIADWELKIHQTRSYYKRGHGILSEAEHKDGKVNILITGVQGKPGKTAIPPTPAAVMDPHQPSLPREPEELVSGLNTTQGERNFWMEVFLTSMRQNPGGEISWHVGVADAAIDGLVRKLGHG